MDNEYGEGAGCQNASQFEEGYGMTSSIMKIRRIVDVALVVFLIVHIGFGLIKQAKKAFYAFPDSLAHKTEPGRAAHDLKKQMPKTTEEVGYQTNRSEVPGERPAVEYYYDVQYGLAPIVVNKESVLADYGVLDYSGKPLTLKKSQV